AQHLEDANYALCERFSDLKHPRAAQDSLADTVKARWPKDTLVERLRASLRFCDSALDRAGGLRSAALASSLLAFETDLAEHYSQLATYMQVFGVYPGPIDTKMGEVLTLEKASPADAARAIVAGIIAGDEEIFPDRMSQGTGPAFFADPKGLERQVAGVPAVA
ncbi:MAG: hypothetical protein DMD77_28130, partial [Candidatus Rokuibacteriota bacterium]